MNEKQLVLHKYFISASAMKLNFEQIISNTNLIIKNELQVEANIYMFLWYSCLYVVIEGWEELKLSDKKIDDLLKSKNVQLLKGLRNDTFHFKKSYINQRTQNFLQDPNIVRWVRELHKNISDWFHHNLPKA